jgi:ferritin
MAAYLEAINLNGSAHWMRVQAEEEMEHAMKFYDFVYDRGGKVELEAIDKPPTEFASPLDVFEKVYAHEQKVTGLINDLYALAVEEKDYASQVFLHWFIDEQVEEEKNADAIVQRLKFVGDKGHALLLIDRELAARGGD